MNRAGVAVLGLLLLGAGARAEDGAGAKVIVTPVLSADVNSAGQPIVFPQLNGHVTVSLFEVPPGVILPAHKHPYPRMGYVLSGSLRVTNLQTGVSQTYKSGDAVLESVGQWHEGTNAGSDMLRLLVIDLLDKGAENTLLRSGSTQ